MSKPRKSRGSAAAAAAAVAVAKTKKNTNTLSFCAAAPPPARPKPVVAAAAPEIDARVINRILERDRIAAEITDILAQFENNREDNMFKKGIYIYGPAGSGKTEFIVGLLKSLNYDVIKYDTGDVRNKALIDTITKHNMSDTNVLSSLRGEPRKISILMDEIDGMNNGDKGGITALIKLIRQKKTKKQKLEDITMNPIICIGNYHTDKKIRELMKVCNTFELRAPTAAQIGELVCHLGGAPDAAAAQIADMSQGDLRKMFMYYKIYQKNPAIIGADFFQKKTHNENTKKITDILLTVPQKMSEHNILMNETDRTIVALLWHENIVDRMPAGAADFYLRVLDNICFSDYIDRITFQNQIWQFNEMTSLIKTFYNNKIFHDTFGGGGGSAPPKLKPKRAAVAAATEIGAPSDIRFTKVLTKYSTEYNNILFIYNLCQQLDMDAKDVLAFFSHLRARERSGGISPSVALSQKSTDSYSETEFLTKMERFFENYEINKLYIKRIYRYIDKNVKKDNTNDEDLLEDDDTITED